MSASTQLKRSFKSSPGLYAGSAAAIESGVPEQIARFEKVGVFRELE
jgi:hypothetical protein